MPCELAKGGQCEEELGWGRMEQVESERDGSKMPWTSSGTTLWFLRQSLSSAGGARGLREEQGV